MRQRPATLLPLCLALALLTAESASTSPCLPLATAATATAAASPARRTLAATDLTEAAYTELAAADGNSGRTALNGATTDGHLATDGATDGAAAPPPPLAEPAPAAEPPAPEASSPSQPLPVQEPRQQEGLGGRLGDAASGRAEQNEQSSMRLLRPKCR